MCILVCVHLLKSVWEEVGSGNNIPNFPKEY